jgi:hypothetical protein
MRNSITSSLFLLNGKEKSMKTKLSLFQKLFMVSIIVALMTAFLPALSVFAAPASDRDSYGDLELEWSNKLRNWRGESLFYTQARVFPADFKDEDDLARAHDLLNKYGFALKQANQIIFEHAGFDERGHVLDEELADQSIRDLAENLHIMRGIRGKLEEAGYKIWRVR